MLQDEDAGTRVVTGKEESGFLTAELPGCVDGLGEGCEKERDLVLGFGQQLDMWWRHLL